MERDNNKIITQELQSAVKTIKAAILQSQARAIQMVNQEQLSLYYGIGRYVSEHSRKGYWGTGAIGTISKQLKSELPGLKGFSEENIKLMRRFYETWKDIETISVVGTTDLQKADSEAERTAATWGRDVLAEQAKINSADAIVFIYPVFWTEAPAKLVGWFDRVWSYGFAYGDKTMKVLDKALILCTAGKNLDDLENLGLLDCMKKVMLGDRLFNRVKESDFIVFDGMSKARDSRKTN